MTEHTFGGSWTEEKLRILGDYLKAYRHIFDKNERAKYLKPIYVDAFAGTGSRTPTENDEILQSQLDDNEAQSFRKGSARIALDLDPPFAEYVFIEKKSQRAAELQKLKFEYPKIARSIIVIQDDANTALVQWSASMKPMDRAVVFLDPYGMQVDWSTIQELGQTKKIDMWLLFPIGMGVNRLLTKNRMPNEAEARRLTACFGTGEWANFYRINPQQGLYSSEPQYIKDVTYDGLAEFFIERLRTAFHAVSDNYRLLRNSKNSPLYMLCFAAANEVGAKPAMNIAKYLLKKE